MVKNPAGIARYLAALGDRSARTLATQRSTLLEKREAGCQLRISCPDSGISRALHAK